MRQYEVTSEWKRFTGFRDMAEKSGGFPNINVESDLEIRNPSDSILKVFNRKRLTLIRVIRTDGDEQGVCRVAELYIPKDLFDQQAFSTSDEITPQTRVIRAEITFIKPSLDIDFIIPGGRALTLERVLQDKETKRIVQFALFYLNPDRWEV